MHSINGYIFGNLRGLTMRSGDEVRWYLMGMGNRVRLAHASLSRKDRPYKKHRADVIELLPASMATVDMKADNPAHGCTIASRGSLKRGW